MSGYTFINLLISDAMFYLLICTFNLCLCYSVILTLPHSLEYNTIYSKMACFK